MPIQEILQQIVTQLRGIWRYRWYTMAIAWIIAIAGWTFVMQLEDQYTASAKVSVNTDSILRPLLSGLAIQSNVKQRVQFMTRRLLTPTVLEKVVSRTDLISKVTNDASMSGMVSMLRKIITIKSSKRTNIYTISAVYTDPKIVKDIVQVLVDLFVEGPLDETRSSSNTAQKFLEKQIEQYAEKLRAAENRRKAFTKKFAGRIPSSNGKSYYVKLQSERETYETALLKLREAEFRRNELKSQMMGEEPVFGILNSGSDQNYPHPLDSRIKKMQTDLNSLLLQYTEQHPKIISIKERMGDLVEQRSRELALIPNRIRRTNIDKNPVYQQLKIGFGRAEAEVSALQVRVNEYRQRVAKSQRLADTVPEIESKLNDLDRDYALNKRNYDTMIARLESAKLGQAAEKTGDDIKFEVINKPRAPLQASGPKRVLFSSIAVIAGIVIGVFVAFVMSQIRPTFYDQRTLRQVTGLPVFGSVSRIWTPQLLLKKRIEFGGFVSVGLILFVAYFGVIYIGTSAPELKTQLTSSVKAISK